ncbi:galanin peptides-like isoform X2 [Sphaerodactylus townsendi]|uniref:galanin peptides-like isoform X2 n=1 Tax=Sphaerodactylus townsendi TaxID=933632 RepID=UPI00202611E7|nr:galanin peptides-like isoform X2 [Sphaerodactylus townsendi]
MWHSRPMLCFSLLLCGLLGECLGTALLPKDKRGWTLNSAGYLLGPHAHQTLTDKGGLAGKREAMEDLYSLGQDPFATAVRPAEESTLQTLMDFLSFLHLREQAAVSRLPLPLVEKSVQQ